MSIYNKNKDYMGFCPMLFSCGHENRDVRIEIFKFLSPIEIPGWCLLRNFSVAISVSPYVCFILVLILVSMFLR